MTNVLIERKDNIGIVTVNRPEQMNSLNSITRKEMAEAFHELGNDSNILVIILAGASGKAFIAGCLLYTSPSPRDRSLSRMPSSA